MSVNLTIVICNRAPVEQYGLQSWSFECLCYPRFKTVFCECFSWISQGSCSELLPLLGNLFFSPHFIITLGAQVKAVVSAPGAEFSASVTVFNVTTFNYLLYLTTSDWITLHNLLDMFSLFFWLNVCEESSTQMSYLNSLKEWLCQVFLKSQA